MNTSEKAKHQPPRYKIKWLFVIGAVVFICACPSLGFSALLWGNASTRCLGILFPSYADVEKNAFFELPSSAHNFAYDIDKFRSKDCTIWVNFEIDPEDLETFRASTLIRTSEPTESDRNDFLYRSQKNDWTQPAGIFVGRGVIGDGNYTIQWVFIDMADPSNFIVHIIAYKGPPV